MKIKVLTSLRSDRHRTLVNPQKNIIPKSGKAICNFNVIGIMLNRPSGTYSAYTLVNASKRNNVLFAFKELNEIKGSSIALFGVK